MVREGLQGLIGQSGEYKTSTRKPAKQPDRKLHEPKSKPSPNQVKLCHNSEQGTRDLHEKDLPKKLKN